MKITELSGHEIYYLSDSLDIIELTLPEFDFETQQIYISNLPESPDFGGDEDVIGLSIPLGESDELLVQYSVSTHEINPESLIVMTSSDYLEPSIHVSLTKTHLINRVKLLIENFLQNN